MSTIYALSTLMGKSGVAIVRVSGKDSLKALSLLGISKNLKPNECRYAEIFDPTTSEQIDQCMVTYFKEPKSFTGEDVIEFSLHGSIAVIEHLLDALSKMSFLRMAEPGEFAKRAFLNSKLDLTEAEGLADLIDAETRIQKKVALNQLNGSLSSVYDKWREDIITMLAKLEALIDFPEEDIPTELMNELDLSIKKMIKEINFHLQDHKGEVIKRGLKVAIIGQPNVGKSTLLNALAKNDVAIVSDISGTTRDVINVKIDLDGYPVQLFDTAGIRQTEDIIEQEGVRRAIKLANDADLVLFLIDATDRTFDHIKFLEDYTFKKDPLIIANKSDLSSNRNISNATYISAKSGENLDIILALLKKYVIENYSISEEPLITRVRYRNLLIRANELLSQFDKNLHLDISAELVRQAASELGYITGKVDVEDVLDKIFSSFCIGK